MSFSFAVAQLPRDPGLHARGMHGGRQVSRAEAMEFLQSGPEFVDAFVAELRDCPFPAFFFETPPWTTPTLEQPFEFVLMDAPSLASVRADDSAFRSKVDARELVSTFRSLGGDAVLVAPSDRGGSNAHLASFVRTAPDAQVRALWRAAAAALRAECGSAPRWLSTSGLGVPWLHVRIDTRPKYYSYAPYRVVYAGEVRR